MSFVSLFELQAEASLVAEVGTLDCTAGQASLGTGRGREQRSLQVRGVSFYTLAVYNSIVP